MRSPVLKFLFGTILGKRLPTTEGVLEVTGTTSPIRIRRDRYGVPHVTAADDADAWYGLGFCQGQDRAFQIESLVRVVRGTTAELAGRETLPLDRLSRRIGFTRAAARTWPHLAEGDRTALHAFTHGINDGRDDGCGRLPHEFALLRGRPTAVEPADVVGMVALQAFALAANWDTELARVEILERDGEDALEAVDPRYPDWHPVTEAPHVEAGAPLEALRAGLELLRDVVGGGGASNNWALSAERTASGRPLVANDPHLAPSLPPHWYLAHLTTPDWGIAGAAFAGTPGFISAHNGKVAWGITAGLVDNTDLFIEEIGEDGASVQRGDVFVPCEVIEEEIEVRGGRAVTESVLIAPSGPIVGPALTGAHEAIAMAATWLAPQRTTSLVGLGRVQSVGDLRRELSLYSGPSLNFVAADVAGTIGWQLAGEAPVRKAGRGALPLPAWIPETGWEDTYLGYDEMPASTDPPSGFVATANARPTASDEPFLGVDWIEGYRMARINEIIGARADWDVASSLQAQLDVVTPAWAELKESILSLGHTSTTTMALSLLRSWDGDLSADSAAAAVFILWLTDMQRRVAVTAAPSSAETALGRGFAPAAIVPYSLFAFGRTSHLVRLLRSRPEGWFDSWDDAIANSLAAAEAKLRTLHGPDPAHWGWGRVRPLTLSHAIGVKRPLDRIFNIGPIPWGGDFSTVSQAGAPPLDPLGNPSAVASLRMAVDVGKWDESRFSLPGGQSGNPMSPHYDDQIDAWRLGLGIPMPWTEDAVAAATRETVYLIPTPGGAVDPVPGP